MTFLRRFIAVAAVLFAAAVAHADELYPHLYIGVDGLPTLTSGAYAGLTNPNSGRLTLLLGDGDHYHSIGAYTYEGPKEAAVVLDTSANNRLPELYQRETGVPYLSLTPGTGAHAGLLVSALGYAGEYEGLAMQAAKSLDVPGDAEKQLLYNSSGGRWTSSLGNAQVALELVSLTPGLHVADAAGGGMNILTNPGDLYTLGTGDGLFFEPLFWTDGTAIPGVYSAEFRLHDQRGSGGSYAASGRFSVDFRVSPSQEAIPEPGTISLLAAAIVPGLGLVLRRRACGAPRG